MSKELRIGLGLGILGIAMGIIGWLVKPETIPYGIRFGIISCAFLLLLGGIWLALKGLLKAKHTGIEFKRSPQDGVITREKKVGNKTFIHELKGGHDMIPATFTEVYTSKDGKEFIVEQEVNKPDGSTKNIRPEQ